ncbi:MAG: glycosyltransferase family 39 protein [Anaerolineales bacterium]
MKEILYSRLQRNTNLLLFAISLIPISLFVFVVSQRIFLPMTLEWGEGAGLNQISRIYEGKALFVEPSIDFSALVYTPIYYYLSAALSYLIKPALLAARLLSLLCTIASAVILYRLVKTRTDDPLSGWFSLALYFSCYYISDGYFDLARVDALYVFIVLAAFCIFLNSKTKVDYFFAGMMIAIGFFVKQSAIIVFLPVTIYLLKADWKRTWILLPVVILAILIPVVVLNQITDGWFGYYIFELPSEHGFSLLAAMNFWSGDLMRYLGIALGFSAVYVIFSFPSLKELGEVGRQQKNEKFGNEDRVEGGDALLTVLFASGAVLASWLTRSSNGGGANNVMLAYSAVALMFGLGINRAQSFINIHNHKAVRLQLLIGVLVAIQFLSLIYNPFKLIPTQGEITAHGNLVEVIKDTSGPVLIPYRSSLSLETGKASQIHAVNLFELTGYFLGELRPEGRMILGQIQQNVCDQTYSMIILDQPMPWFQEQIDLAYQRSSFGLLPETSRRSEQLEWQNGYANIYIPANQYQRTTCLKTVIYPEE